MMHYIQAGLIDRAGHEMSPDNKFFQALSEEISKVSDLGLRASLEDFASGLYESDERGGNLFEESFCAVGIWELTETCLDTKLDLAVRLNAGMTYIWLLEFSEAHPTNDQYINSSSVISDAINESLEIACFVDFECAGSNRPKTSSIPTIEILRSEVPDKPSPFPLNKGSSPPRSGPAPFQTQTLESKSLVDRLFNRAPRANFLIELNNLISKAGTPTKVKEVDVLALRKFYKSSKRFGSSIDDGSLKELYRNYLDWYWEAAANGLTTQEIALAKFSETLPSYYSRDIHQSLQTVFELAGLTPGVMHRVRKEFLEPYLYEWLSEAWKVHGQSVTLGETDSWEPINDVVDTLALEQETIDGIYLKFARYVCRNLASYILSFDVFSPEHFHLLRACQRQTNARIKLETSLEANLSLRRDIWVLKNCQLPVIKSVDGVRLQKKETCHYDCIGGWYQERTKTRRIGHTGGGFSVPVGGGVRALVGGTQSRVVSYDEWQKIDEGRILLTSHRIICSGEKKNLSIRVDDIIRFRVWGDGIEIFKASGRPYHLMVSGFDRDRIEPILERLEIPNATG